MTDDPDDPDDPIEKAADAIIELINSRPQSPRKEEIMDVLRLHHPHRPEGFQVSQEALLKGLNSYIWVGVAWPAGSVTTASTTSHGDLSGASVSSILPLQYDGYANTSEDSAEACDLSEASFEQLISQLEGYRQLPDPSKPCLMYRDGAHRMGGLNYDGNSDAYIRECTCGYRKKSILQK